MFSAQLEKSRDASNLANARSIYGQLVADYLDDSKIQEGADKTSLTLGSSAGDVKVGGNTFHFQKVTGAELTITNGATNSETAPIVTYKGKNYNETFGSAS